MYIDWSKVPQEALDIWTEMLKQELQHLKDVGAIPIKRERLVPLGELEKNDDGTFKIPFLKNLDKERGQ